VIDNSPRNRAERRAADRGQRRHRLSRAAGSALVVSSTALATSAALFGAAGPAGAASQTFTVDNAGDAAPVASHCTDVTVGNCTLRDAIAAANANVDAANPDIINFDAAVLPLITITQGQIKITDSVTINGPGASALTVKGTGADRLFYLDDGTASSIDVVISGLTLTHDATKVTGPGNHGGGAIRDANEHVTIADSVITGNSVFQGYGGALYSDTKGSTWNIQRSQITNNTADRGAGAAWIGYADVTISDSTISGNTAAYAAVGCT
jgi:hypothetical protein